MIFFNSLFFLIFFLLLIIVGIYFINKFNISPPHRFQLLITYLGSLSVLLVTYNIYLNIESNNRIEKNRYAYNTIENIQQNYLDPQEELLNHFPESFFLYASMNQDIDFGENIPLQYDHTKRKQLEVYYSLRIFQAIEDFLSTGIFDITGTSIWLNNFLMWMQSPILQYYWKILCFNYATDTRTLVNQIIEKANELVELRKQKGALSSDDYDRISKKLKVSYR